MDLEFSDAKVTEMVVNTDKTKVPAMRIAKLCLPSVRCFLIAETINLVFLDISISWLY